MKAKKPCKQPGCSNLVDNGYCEKHQKYQKKYDHYYSVKSLRKLDEKKDNKTIKFYNSAPWKKTSYLYRKKHPLCERCYTRGKIVASTLVHHKTELIELWQKKLNPLSWRYLQALCNNCHLEDLRNKKNLNSR